MRSCAMLSSVERAMQREEQRASGAGVPYGAISERQGSWLGDRLAGSIARADILTDPAR